MALPIIALLQFVDPEEPQPIVRHCYQPLPPRRTNRADLVGLGYEHTARAIMHDIVAHCRIALAPIPLDRSAADWCRTRPHIPPCQSAERADAVPTWAHLEYPRYREWRLPEEAPEQVGRPRSAGAGQGSAACASLVSFGRNAPRSACSMSRSICCTSGNSSRCASWSARPRSRLASPRSSSLPRRNLVIACSMRATRRSRTAPSFS